MFVSWRTYRATTGTVENRFAFECQHCGAQTVALVQSVGEMTSTALYGAVGGSAEAARIGAQTAAYGNAIRGLQDASCPRCSGFQPAFTAMLDQRAAIAKQKEMRALPIAAAMAALIALALAYPAVKDLRHSSALLTMSIALTVAAFGVSYAMLRWPPRVPTPPKANVYFWWARPGEAPGWLPPPTARPFISEPSRALPALALMTGAPAGLVALVALLVWTASKR